MLGGTVLALPLRPSLLTGDGRVVHHNIIFQLEPEGMELELDEEGKGIKDEGMGERQGIMVDDPNAIQITSVTPPLSS